MTKYATHLSLKQAVIRAAAAVAILLGITGCALPINLARQVEAPPAPTEGALPATETPTPTPSEAPATPEPTTDDTVQAIPTASFTPLPSPTPLDEPTEATAESTAEATPLTATETTPAAGQPSPVPADTPPLIGTFDVYLGAPDSSGGQLLRWMDTETGEKVSEITIKAKDNRAVRAGEYVYFVEAGTGLPVRANTAGAIETLAFAGPLPGAGDFQFMPSGNGNFLAWMSVLGDGTYAISHAASDGTLSTEIIRGNLEPGALVKLVRLSNDGRNVFYNIQPVDTTDDKTLFNAYTDLYMLNVSSGEVTELPGEPPCGPGLVCDAHVSLDGTYLLRTLPPATASAPIIVTNLVSGTVVARFTPEDVPNGAAFEIGYPFLTPGGEMIYMIAYGPPELENYMLVWANLLTGEQHVVSELGTERHRPLGWAGAGQWLLTTVEPDSYETWQTNIETGDTRRIAGMLFLGYINNLPTP